MLSTVLASIAQAPSSAPVPSANHSPLMPDGGKSINLEDTVLVFKQ